MLLAPGIVREDMHILSNVTQLTATTFRMDPSFVEEVAGQTAADRKVGDYERGAAGAATAVAGLCGEIAVAKLLQPDENPGIQVGQSDSGIDMEVMGRRNLRVYGVDVKTNLSPTRSPRSAIGKWDGTFFHCKRPPVPPEIIISAQFVRRVKALADIASTPVEVTGWVMFDFDGWFRCTECLFNVREFYMASPAPTVGMCPSHSAMMGVPHKLYPSRLNLIPRRLKPLDQIVGLVDLVR